MKDPAPIILTPAQAKLSKDVADSTAGWPILYAIGASFVIGLVHLLALTLRSGMHLFG